MRMDGELRLAAVFEEHQLGPGRAEIKTNGAVPADVIARDAATGPHAVDLVESDVGAHVEFAPRFQENGAAYLFGEKLLQSGTYST